jgi:hypothetical protein
VVGIEAHPLEEDLIGTRRVAERGFTSHRGASIRGH